MFLETESPKNMNAPNGGAYFKPIMRRLCQGGMSKCTSKLNLRGLWMVVFHFFVLPNLACPRTLSQIYLGIWFWGTHGVTNIV